MKHIFLIHPEVEKSFAAELVRLALSHYEEKIDSQVFYAKEPGESMQYIRECCQKEKEPLRFYVCGEKVPNELVGGFIGHSDAELAWLPILKDEKHSAAWLALRLAELIRAKSERMDVLCVNGHYALNMVNLGIDVRMLRRAKNRKPNGKKGKMKYWKMILPELFHPMHTKATIQADGEVLNHGKLLLCNCANTPYSPGIRSKAPRAKIDDGLLEVCLIRPISRLKMLKYWNVYLEGTHLDDPRLFEQVVYRRARSVFVKFEGEMEIMLDDFLLKTASFTVELLEKAIRMVPCNLQDRWA